MLFVRKSRKWSQKNHSWGMMDQNFLSKWFKRSLSIICIMISHNPDQKNAPFSWSGSQKCSFFWQIKKCPLCFDPNQKKCSFFWSGWKKNILFINRLLIWIKKMLVFIPSGLTRCSLFFDLEQKYLIRMKKWSFFLFASFFWARFSFVWSGSKNYPFFWMSIKKLREFFWSGGKIFFFIQIIFHISARRNFWSGWIFIWFNN